MPHDLRTVLDVFNITLRPVYYFFLISLCAVSTLLLIQSLIALIFQKKAKHQESVNEDEVPFVTVQIPTRNEIIALRCAQRCLESDYPKDKLQILIGDDSSAPFISNEIALFAELHPEVQILKRERNTGFKPGNLNNMLEVSQGEVIVVLDSDFMPDKDFIRNIVAPFVQDVELSAVQARWSCINRHQNLVTAMAASINDNIFYVLQSFLRLLGIGFLYGSAQAVRKKDLLELGKWREGGLGEDIEFSLRLLSNAKKITYLSGVDCKSELPHRLKDLCKQQMKWSYGIITAYKLHLKRLLFNRRVPVQTKLASFIPVLLYAMVGLVFCTYTIGHLYLFTLNPAILNLYWQYVLKLYIIGFVLSSGYVYISIFTLFRTGRIGLIPKTLLASYSVGVVVTYYVAKGIYKALLGLPMRWYLVQKSTDYGTPKKKCEIEEFSEI